MAGLEGRVPLTTGLKAHVRLAEQIVRGEAQTAAVEAGIEGLAAARTVVATTPSSLSRVPKNNRIWTGKMIAELDSDVKIKGHSITVRVGWLNKKERYFLIQEDGGKVRNVTVTPMNALAQSQAVMLKKLADRGIL